MHGLRMDTEHTKRIIRWLMEEWIFLDDSIWKALREASTDHFKKDTGQDPLFQSVRMRKD
jgi:hypothetical protein